MQTEATSRTRSTRACSTDGEHGVPDPRGPSPGRQRTEPSRTITMTDTMRTEGPEREGMKPEPQGKTRRCRDPECRQEYSGRKRDPCPECGKSVTSVAASEPRCAGVAPSVSEVVSHRVA